MKLQPKISVLMPVYNNARYLKPAIDSILSQSFSDFELLILDDGSTDRSQAVLQAYADRDPRIRLSSQPNQGIAKTRNKLLAQAQGEFIAVMDGDDVALPDRLAKQVAFLQAHPAIVCVGSALDWIDERDRYVGHCPMPQTDSEIQTLLLGGIAMIHHPCTLIRRSALLQVGGYDETLQASVDLDLWLRLGEVGQLANLPDTLLRYRLHSRSVTHARQQRQTADARTACERAWQRRGIVGEFIRQPADHLHHHQFWLNCGWQGFNQGWRDVARRCGWQAIVTQPLSGAAWKLWLCAWIKPLPSLQTS